MESSSQPVKEDILNEFHSEVIKGYPNFDSLYSEDEEKEKIAKKFLFARKFNVPRAVQLFLAHQKLRENEALNEIDPCDESIRRELLSEKFTVLLQPDQSGAIIAIFNVRLHWPGSNNCVSLKNTLRALILQLDSAMESENAQRHGVIFIYDMYQSKLANFDYHLSIKIISMLQGCYPARLRRVYIVTPPFWFRAPFKLLQLLRDKLRQRVYTVNSREALLRHFTCIASENQVEGKKSKHNFIHLPQEMGGHIKHSHRDWLKSVVLKEYLTKLPSNYFDTQLHVNGETTSEVKTTGVDLTWEECCVDSLSGEDDMDSVSGVAFNSLHSSHGEHACCTGIEETNSVNITRSINTPSVHAANDADAIFLIELIDHIRNVGEYTGLIREYTTEIQMWEQRQRPVVTFTSFKKMGNVNRNRYSDVPCIEETRVILHLRPEGNDYIHANWVDGYRQKNAFICAQGPLTNTVTDFWAMIWEYHIPIIIMTTKLREQQRIKCHLYWPESQGQQNNIHINEDIELSVINEEVEENEAFRTTRLKLCNIKTSETRKVIHLFFHAWPDHAAPESSTDFLSLLSAYRSHYAASLQEWGYPCPESWWRSNHLTKLSFDSNDNSDIVEPNPQGPHHEEPESCTEECMNEADMLFPNPPPALVHCSAGIGRTGTFVAMDINTKRLEHTSQVSVINSVRHLRAQRHGSVQTAKQYIFLYSTILDYARQIGLLIDSDETGDDTMDNDVDTSLSESTTAPTNDTVSASPPASTEEEIVSIGESSNIESHTTSDHILSSN